MSFQNKARAADSTAQLSEISTVVGILAAKRGQQPHELHTSGSNCSHEKWRQSFPIQPNSAVIDGNPTSDVEPCQHFVQGISRQAMGVVDLCRCLPSRFFSQGCVPLCLPTRIQDNPSNLSSSCETNEDGPQNRFASPLKKWEARLHYWIPHRRSIVRGASGLSWVHQAYETQDSTSRAYKCGQA